MENLLSIDENLLRRLLVHLTGTSEGRVVVNLGRWGTAQLLLNRLSIGHDSLEVPLLVTTDALGSGQKELLLCLSGWQLSAGILWCTLERVGSLSGPLLNAFQKALITLINRALSGPGTGGELLHDKRRLGIPMEAILRRIGYGEPPMHVTSVTVNKGITI
ncbi:MAG: hypothetical protein V3W14_11965, partial [Candidatus Neomarinimicrobiota bacterium]